MEMGATWYRRVSFTCGVLPSSSHRLEGQALPGSLQTGTLNRSSSRYTTVDGPEAGPPTASPGSTNTPA